MIRKIRKWLCLSSKFYRYIMSAMLLIIVIVSYVKHKGDLDFSFEPKKCEKLVINEFSNKAKKYISFAEDKHLETLNATELRRWILSQNAHQKVLNRDIYGPLTTNTFIFIVQVHRYSCNLNYMLASFSEVEGIEDTLIIFSHSFVDRDLNRLIQSIQFCRILQLFYPYSIQAYPNEFPGYDKNIWPSKLNIRAAKIFYCPSAITSNEHGEYRDPIYTEKKHHWWWTANKVFGDLSYTTGHKGIVVFIQNYFYIFKNFIYIAYEMKRISDSLPQCDFLSLGSTLPVRGQNAYSLVFTTWNPKYSYILAIDLSVWNSIISHYDIFCCTNDYSWSRSLYEVSINRRDGKMFKVLSSAAAAALQTSCSSTKNVMDCHVVKNIIEIAALQKSDKILFPSYFEIIHDIELYDDEVINADYIEVNSGWNDERDKQLCSNMTINNVKKYLVTKEPMIDLEAYY